MASISNQKDCGNVAESASCGRNDILRKNRGGGVPPLVMQLEGNNEMNYKQNFDLSKNKIYHHG